MSKLKEVQNIQVLIEIVILLLRLSFFLVLSLFHSFIPFAFLTTMFQR